MPLNIELTVGVLRDQPCRTCSLLADQFCGRPAEFVHDLVAVDVPLKHPRWQRSR